MIIPLLIIGIVVLLLFMHWLNNAVQPDDNREAYVRDDDGNVWALRVAGPVGDVPNHEAFIHDGTAHQNPALRDWTATVWFIIFPFPEQRQERFYPLTANGNGVDLSAIEQRVNRARLRRHQEVELTTMPRWAEKAAINRENGEQRARGVPGGKLEKRGL